jgi:hypothetical protein
VIILPAPANLNIGMLLYPCNYPVYVQPLDPTCPFFNFKQESPKSRFPDRRGGTSRDAKSCVSTKDFPIRVGLGIPAGVKVRKTNWFLKKTNDRHFWRSLLVQGFMIVSGAGSAVR